MSVKPARTARTTDALPVLNPNAAGADIGATEIYAAVPQDRDPQPVRRFATFTQDLHALADWLEQCGVKTIAMESTGVYWIPLFQILEARGMEVCLVNARHVKNVPGRKSDVLDCQWLQYLHACGLLRASFRPKQEVCALRSILRHRDSLVTYAASHVQHMQKALDQMNLQLHHVITDITGKTGLAILDALLAGERNPHTLAQLKDYRVKAKEVTIAKALTGDYRSEHLFTLRQALAAYRQYQQWVSECDQEIERLLQDFEAREFDDCVDPQQTPLPPATATQAKQQSNKQQSNKQQSNKQQSNKQQSNTIRLRTGDLRTELSRILGVDLTAVPGLASTSVHSLFSEIGRDLSAFATAKHFASWLGLCPANKVSGGKVLSVKTRDVRHRAADTLRLCAQSLHHSKSALGAFYRRMRAKLGAPKAITATAHKLARIVYHLLRTRQSYEESAFTRSEAVYQQRRVDRLHREAAALGFTLSQTEAVPT